MYFAYMTISQQLDEILKSNASPENPYYRAFADLFICHDSAINVRVVGHY